MEKEWLRYSCQMALPHFNKEAQKRLQAARVLIVGAGGLGCPAAQYLAAAGVGTIAIADYDLVSPSNLHRQILYTPDDIGQPKAVMACKKLCQQNPQVQLIPINAKITSENVLDIVKAYDIVVDGTDNFDTRYLLNDACVLTGKPLVYGAIYQFEGQAGVWNILNKDGSRSPNYRDLFPEVNAAAIPNCAEGGVLPTLAGIIGCVQATEVIKYFAQTGELLAGKLFVLDARTLESRIVYIGNITHVDIKSIAQTEPVPTISIKDLRGRLQSDDIALIDVRSKEERSHFHIGGEHIPITDLDITPGLEVKKSVVFYCSTGKRSAEAVRLIKKRFPAMSVFSLEGGLKAWQEQL
jgi:sulfur-carrier protein adenylyltransferase/sulfurtransferase